MHPRCAVGVVLLMTACPPSLGVGSVASAAQLGWQDAPYPYSVINQDVTEAIKNFGYNTGLRVSVAQDVRGTVRGHQTAGTAREFIDDITRSNDLDWYSDGTVMYVSPVADEGTVLVPLRGVAFGDLEKRLKELGLLDNRFRLTKRKAGNVAIVSGPPSYTAVVENAIKAETDGSEKSDMPVPGTVLVFRGNASSSIRLP